MTTVTDTQLQELVDEHAITKLLVTFSRCIDTKDFEGYAQLYTPDGELVTPWGGHKGREGLAEHVRGDLGKFHALHHISAGHDIQLEGDRATVRATLLATHVTTDTGTGTEFWTVGGHYDIEVVKQDHSWFLDKVTINPAWRFDTPPKEN